MGQEDIPQNNRFGIFVYADGSRSLPQHENINSNFRCLDEYATTPNLARIDLIVYFRGR